MPSAVGVTHHLKLGTEFLMIRPNSYQKVPAPTFGARVATGNPSYNNLSIWQHWVQKCWIGGNGAEEWVDDSMYDFAYGVDTTQHEQMRLTRDLQPAGATGTLGGATSVAAMQFCIFNNTLYCLVMTNAGTTSRLYSFNPATVVWTAVTLPANFIARSITTFDAKMFIGGSNAGPKLYYATAPGTWTTATNPAGVTQAIYCMLQFNGKLYVAFGTQVWRMKDDQTWDGNIVFYKTNANSGSNYIVAMEQHLGFMYMLSQNGHLHRTDSNNTFDIWAWDGQTRGVSLRSYDGKLFVGTYEWESTPDVGFGVLYQFTGNAVTELKRWGKPGKATVIGGMVVHGRKLYYGASSEFGRRDAFSVGVYDTIEDAHSIWATNPDTTTYPDITIMTRDATTISPGVGAAWLVDDVIFFGDYMYCTVRGYGVFRTKSTFDAINTGVATFTAGAANAGFIRSSLYDGGTPGMDKLWRKITVYGQLQTSAASYVLSYSIDGGVTFTALPSQVGPTSATAKQVFYLNNIHSSRFKWSLTLTSTNASISPIIRGVVVSYLPNPEPNWMWSFTVPVADNWELLDKTTEVKSTNALIAYLEGLFRSQNLVTFIDVDGVTWASNGPGVIVYDITTVQFDIEAPNREADIRIRLLEAVETY